MKKYMRGHVGFHSTAGGTTSQNAYAGNRQRSGEDVGTQAKIVSVDAIFTATIEN